MGNVREDPPGAAERAGSKVSFILGAIIADMAKAIMNVSDVLYDLGDMLNFRHRNELQKILVKLGWRRYDGDLWRHDRSGVVVSFLDAVAMELETSVQEKKIFGVHSVKEP